MSELTKTTSALTLDRKTRPATGEPGMAVFTSEREEGRPLERMVCLSAKSFALLGHPDQITVTIEIGDTLNEGPES